MELALGSLVGRAVSRAMSIGDHGLRKSLGTLAAEGVGGCVPVQLVV